MVAQAPLPVLLIPKGNTGRDACATNQEQSLNLVPFWPDPFSADNSVEITITIRSATLDFPQGASVLVPAGARSRGSGGSSTCPATPPRRESVREAFHHETLPDPFLNYSTHAFSVAEAVEMARALDQLPPHLIVYGIEGKDFAAGEGLSVEVEAGARKAVEQILKEIRPGIHSPPGKDVRAAFRFSRSPSGISRGNGLPQSMISVWDTGFGS